MRSALIIQTAFAGDLILTTPLITETARCFPDASIDVLCIPSTQGLLANHPDVRERIVYDKRQRKPGMLRMMRDLRARKYDLCLSPHRSLRSTLLAWSTAAGVRAAFDTAAASFLYSATVKYMSDEHEVHRVLSLLVAAGKEADYDTPPRLYPSEEDVENAVSVMDKPGVPYVCIAPGSVWATKRWTEEGFAETVRHLSRTHTVVLIGGKEDQPLCERITARSGTECVNAAGRLSLLGSAALIRDAAVLISNDSAPVHMASAMNTPVVEIFGSTVPAFGFTPVGVSHRIVQREDLDCRPCGIHGGEECPIGTFVCMKELAAEQVVEAAQELLDSK